MFVDYLLFFKGFLAGAFISFPVGPIGIICLRRMLTQGPVIGLASGIGGATADIVYAAIALAGLSFVSSFLAKYAIALRILSGIFLMVLGLNIIQSRVSGPKQTWTATIAQAYFSTFFLTLTNPLLILSFAALFAALDVATLTTHSEILTLISGLFFGSCFWWLLLAGTSGWVDTTITPWSLKQLNTISGVIIIFFGIITILSILIK